METHMRKIILCSDCKKNTEQASGNCKMFSEEGDREAGGFIQYIAGGNRGIGREDCAVCCMLYS